MSQDHKARVYSKDAKARVLFVNCFQVWVPLTLHLQGAPGFDPTTLGNGTLQGIKFKPPQCSVAVQLPIGILQWTKKYLLL